MIRGVYSLSSFIEFHHVYKSYQMGEVEIVASRNVNFSIERGEFVVIVGPSGAGKSTFMNILGGIDKADRGSVLVDGRDVTKFSDKQLTLYRRYEIGFIFQFYNLIQNLTAKENVELAAQLCKKPSNVLKVLKSVELQDRMDNFPSALSGGEQQRVAIARALVKKPKILLCDEPTGALDYNTGKSILRLLQETCTNTNTTVIIITHNQSIAPMADRIIEIRNSSVRRISRNLSPVSVDSIEW